MQWSMYGNTLDVRHVRGTMCRIKGIDLDHSGRDKKFHLFKPSFEIWHKTPNIKSSRIIAQVFWNTTLKCKNAKSLIIKEMRQILNVH